MMGSRKVCVGVITKPLGIRGQVKIHPYTRSSEFFLSNTKLLLADDSEILLRNPAVRGEGIVTNIGGVENRTHAEAFRMQELYIYRDDMGALAENEYYYEDLVGLDVYDKCGDHIGQIKAVCNYGAGTFLEIQMGNSKVATISFNGDTIKDVNIDNRKLVIDKHFLLT